MLTPWGVTLFRLSRSQENLPRALRSINLPTGVHLDQNASRTPATNIEDDSGFPKHFGAASP
jgi:hypothetical protein